MGNNILLLGDSITQLSWDPNGLGWASLLQNHFQRRGHFITRGFGGYSTEAAVNVILPELENSLKIHKSLNSENFLAATVFFGANDSVLWSCRDNSQHVPLEKFSKNTKQIINHLQKVLQIQTIILITLPLYDDDAWKKATCKKYKLKDVESKRVLEFSENYRKEVIRIGKDLSNVEVCDFWGAMEKQEEKDW